MTATSLDYTVRVDTTTLYVKEEEDWPLDDLASGKTVFLNLQVVVSDERAIDPSHSAAVASFVNKNSHLLLKICQQNLSATGSVITSVDASIGSIRVNIGIVVGAAFAVAVNYQALRDNIPIIAHDTGQFVSMALELFPEVDADEPSPEMGSPKSDKEKKYRSPSAASEEPDFRLKGKRPADDDLTP